ncbi:MAG: tRNA pseudouridine(55) synthase TruB [Saprospirales bacterium]|nr:tRNA pseudouridine(55) synthase TruB [Saprospirales bacterium]MBK8922164.1 tRNA pseudouridine(55) synthase TruB [Saprospirales bacterium]
MLSFLKDGLPFPSEFPKGAILLVDKPLGWTSFDVVNKIRFRLTRRLGVRKFKIGHAGTLDPLASGLLVLCTGEYTRKIESFQAMEKEYQGTITFGATTASFDLEKPVDATFPTGHLTDALLQQTIRRFMGEIDQVPPMFSAVKVGGRRLYKNARTGQEMELTPRKVRIDVLTLGPLRPVSPAPAGAPPAVLNKKGAPIYLYPDYPEGMQADFQVVCSKGTYIRSLAHGLGEAAGTGAYLSRLRRTRTGGFAVSDAWTVDGLAEWIDGGRP